ncbi:MAG: hypothetical protein WCG23_00945 [bacterium]
MTILEAVKGMYKNIKSPPPRLLQHSFTWVDSQSPVIKNLEKDFFEIVTKCPPKTKRTQELYCTSPEKSFNAIRTILEYPNRGKYRKNEQNLLDLLTGLSKKYPEMILHEINKIPSRLSLLSKKVLS